MSFSISFPINNPTFGVCQSINSAFGCNLRSGSDYFKSLDLEIRMAYDEATLYFPTVNDKYYIINVINTFANAIGVPPHYTLTNEIDGSEYRI